MRDLLGHTAGTRDPSEDAVTRARRRHGNRMTARVIIDAAPPPGERTSEAEYSDTGFLIAGAVIARAAGQPVATAMRRELFNHPGGAGLALQPAERPRPPLAHAYWYPHGVADPADLSDGSPYVPSRELAAVADTAERSPATSPHSRAGRTSLLGGHILARTSLREMTRFHPGGFWEAYGLGLARDSIDGRNAS